jgi:hypothetical protein
MTRSSLAAALLLPLVFAACARQPEPAPVPVLSAAEQACVDRAAGVTGADPATVTITPTAATKTGDTIYTVVANGQAYSCTVAPDLTVAQFAMQ